MPPSIDHLLINANVYTLDAAVPRARTLYIRDGRIRGFEAGPRLGDVLAEDLAGTTVLPGFVDAHIHWEWTAMNLKSVDLFDLTSRAASLKRVVPAVRSTERGKWITGFGWAQSMWQDTGGDFPTATDLDAVAPEHPVLLDSRSGHAAWANSMALALAGVNEHTPDPPGGQIQRDAKGRPTGILFEEAIDLVKRQIPEPTALEVADQMEKAQVLAWQCGLTGLHDFDRPRAFQAMQIMQERGTLGLRIVKNINDPYIRHAHALGLRWGFGGEWLRLGGLKIFADGALGSLTARMLEPYLEQPDNYGIVVTEKQRMYELVSEASRLGFPSTIHAIGDEAVRMVLDVLEKVRAEEAAAGIPRTARRHRIEHVQIIHPDDAGRLAELDIIASMQPIHGTADYQMADRYWGDRAKYSYNPRLQLDRGARVAFGSDSPVEPFEPLKGIHAAVTRRRLNGLPGPDGWYPEARLTVEEAIRCYTEGPAWAGGTEDSTGRLAPGYFADLVVLDRDPFQIPADEIPEIRVLGTMVGGQWRHRVGDLGEGR